MHACLRSVCLFCSVWSLRFFAQLSSPTSPTIMAGYSSCDAWTSADVALFEKHYNIAMAKADGHDAKIVKDFDVMKGLMVKYGAAEIQTLPPKLVGVHPDNRDRTRMHAAEMTSKGSKIVSVGASRELCGPNRAWCVQDSDSRKSDHSTVMVAESSDAFASPSPSIAYGSVGCSHWNQFLCAVNQARPTTAENLKDKTGHINKTKIFDEDAIFAALATGGLDWHVIKSGFVAKYGQVPRLFSKALNAEHNIAIGGTWDQQLSSICSIAQLLLEHGDIPWEQVTKHIASSQGPHVSDLLLHLQFVKKNGGGSSLFHMLDTLEFLTLRMPAGRKVSGHWVKMLTTIPMSTDFAVARLVHAIFKCHACCADDACEESLARHVSVPELKGGSGKFNEEALKAEDVLGRLRKVLDATNRPSTFAYGEWSIKIAEVVLGKNKDDSVTDCRCQPISPSPFIVQYNSRSPMEQSCILAVRASALLQVSLVVVHLGSCL